MAEMHKILMDLPLFQGISREQAFRLMEKVHLEFVNFNPGEAILDETRAVDALSFILSGKVQCSWRNDQGSMAIRYTLGPGTVVGVHHLFGMNREASVIPYAMERVSVMRVSKEQYLELIEQNRIYLLNMLNYLSYSAQRPLTRINKMRSCSVHELLALYLVQVVARGSSDIIIEVGEQGLCELTNLSRTRIQSQLRKLKKQGAVQYSDNHIYITDYDAFVHLPTD